MRKKTGLYIRVPEEWLGRVRVDAGACGEGVSEYVRVAVEMRMEGMVVGGSSVRVGEVPKVVKEEVVVPKRLKGEEGGAETPIVPVWSKGLVEKGFVKFEQEKVVSSFGESAPAAVAAVSTPREAVVDTGYWRDPAPAWNVPVQKVKVFEQSEEERAKRMALLRSVPTGMKMQPQMEKPVDPYEVGDVEPIDG